MHLVNLKMILCCVLWLSCSACAGTSEADTAATKEMVSTNPMTNAKKIAVAEYVVEIYEDRQGKLWFGTIQHGLACYDGKTLRYYTTEDGLCGNAIVSITEDEEGNLWLGSHTGVSRFDGKQFVNYGVAQGLSGEGGNLLIDRQGTLWVGTNHGAFRFDGRQFLPFPLPKPPLKTFRYKWEAGKVWNMMEDKQGNLWFARDGYGLCRYDGENFQHFTEEDGLATNIVCGLLQDQRGDIWVGTLSSGMMGDEKKGGLSRFDGTRFTSFPEVAMLSDNDIYSIHQDRRGKVWITALDLGVYRYDGEQFELFNEISADREVIKRYAMQSFLEDRQGRIWAGFSGGLFRFEEGRFVELTREDLGGE